jgi:endonuclease YncB( thermonuclease family)
VKARPYIARITEVIKVTDGDTYWVRVDPGYRATFGPLKIRLLGYDCPERTKGSAFERSEAIRAKSVATEFLAPVTPIPGASLWVRTEKDPDDFGRWLGDVWVESDGDQWPERHLGAELRDKGLASIWPTRWRTEFDHTI